MNKNWAIILLYVLKSYDLICLLSYEQYYECLISGKNANMENSNSNNLVKKAFKVVGLC